MNVAVVTVTYNGGDTPLEWADALTRAWTARPAEWRGSLRAIAVDNASPDDTATRLAQHAPDVEVLALDVNSGFAAGCNTGIAAAPGCDLYILVNPDVLVGPEFFQHLYWLELPPDVACVGPQIIGADDCVEQSARRFPGIASGLWGRTTLLTRWFPRAARGRQLLADPERGRCDVDWVSGACMVIRAPALDIVGPLDAGYFMYWEDADWCRRAHDRGLRVVYDPALQVRHRQGSSSPSRTCATTVAFHRSAYRYFRSHVASNAISRSLGAAILTGRCALKLALVAYGAARPHGREAQRRPSLRHSHHRR